MEKRIQNELMAAMKAKDEVRSNTLRSIKAAILNEKSNGAHHELTDDDIIRLINKQIKFRKDSENVYRSANRDDLADKELAERKILEEFVPKKLTEVETKAAIAKAIPELGVALPNEKGKLIGHLKKEYGELLDMGLVMSVIDSLIK